MVDHLLRRQAPEVQIGRIDFDESTILHPCNGGGDRVDVEEPAEQVAGLPNSPVCIIPCPGPAANTFIRHRSHLPLGLLSSLQFRDIYKRDHEAFNTLSRRAI